MHNGCMVLVFPNPKGLSAKRLLAKYVNVKNPIKEVPLPDAVDVDEMIGEAYAKARQERYGKLMRTVRF
jgi:hypothetical protein